MNDEKASKHRFFDILALKEAYGRGENITELMRTKAGIESNTSEIIETAYDLQSGSYVEYAQSNITKLNQYTSEIGGILQGHLNPEDTLLDVGTGEMTTLCALLDHMPDWHGEVYAFDISWSRIHTARKFVAETYPPLKDRITSFVADLAAIPLRSKSIDVVTSSHALEPNGGRLQSLLEELFRITRRKLVLFEPSYELGSEAARERMNRLGYIRGIQDTVETLGGTLCSARLLDNIARPENPTACYVIEPPKDQTKTNGKETGFSVPGSDEPLNKYNGFFHSRSTGLGFPVINGIPVLKPENAVLMTAL